MVNMPLRIFTNDPDFPLHIQYGSHYGDDCYMHGHEDFSELVIVLDGDAEHLVGEESYHIAKGDVFVINKDTYHGFRSANGIRICNLMFRPEAVLERIYNIRSTAGFQALFVLEPHYSRSRHFRSRLKLNPQDFVDIRRRIENIMDEYQSHREGWQTMFYSMFIDLVVRLSRLYSASDNPNGEILKLASAIAYLEQNFSSDISVSELSRIAGYSERQFNRLFNSAFGMTPLRYIMTLRMQKAQSLISSTNLPLGEIALSCGYDDQNYFSRVFRNLVGLSPSEYRSRNR